MNSKNIFIISYYANYPGACQAEWLDDKIDSFLKLNHRIILLSSTCSHLYKNKNIKHYRISSLSPKDFFDEIKRQRELGLSITLQQFLFLPFILSLGLMLDMAQSILTKGIGEGRWSWALPAFLGGCVIVIFNKVDLLFSTGGPASAHLAGIFIKKIFHKKLIVELQDPLSGSSIGRNSQSAGWLFKIEKFIIRHSDKVVYVTYDALAYAKNIFKADHLYAIYPAAKKFNLSTYKKSTHKKLKLIHLGSLYANRDFQLIIKALDSLIADNTIKAQDIELINLGHVAPHIKDEVAKTNYVKILPVRPREAALNFASEFDINLLIQNRDDRSQVTIPYKTYDYLNLPNKTLGLLNSEELTLLLNKHGHTSYKLNDLDGVTEYLKYFLTNKNLTEKENNQPEKLDPVIQAQDLLEIHQSNSR